MRDLLLARLGDRGASIDREALGRKLDELWVRCAARLPDAAVDREVVVARIADAMLASEGPLDIAAFDRVAADDLYLAAALAVGDDGALVIAERELVPVMRQAAGKIDGNPMTVDEVVQRIRHRLFVGTGDAGPVIATFKGTAPLTRWLRVIATRTAVDVARAVSNHADGDERLAELVAPDDPELALIWHTCADAYKRALASALKAMPKRDRTLLRQRYVDGLELDVLGKIHGVVASTVMRRLRKIEEDLATSTRAALKAELSLSDSQLRSMERMVVGQIPMSLTRMLKAR